AEAPAETRAPASTLPSGLQGRFTFDNFVVGSANDFAYEVARKVGEWDEATFNPVVLHGTYGFGKTHLLNAAAIEAKRLRPDASVVYLTAERFLNTFLQAVRGRATGDFKDEIRAADLLLIDDVHLVGGKPATQEEMFHTLSAVLAGGGRVMLSADRPPQALEEVDARLRSLLTSGLLCGIEPADRELRLGIIQCKLAELRRLGRIPATQVRPEVMEYLADRFSSSVRELEGALNTLVLRAGARLADISRDDANEMLAPHLRVTERRITVDDIQRAVSERFSLSRADLLSPRRTQSVARPRQIGMWLCKQLTSRSLPDIGRRFGGKDHTTVLHAIRRIDQLRGDDAQIMADSDALMRQLRG
ncbi:MAG: chromosomal replication initiator protein DnaA, partial [Caulobacteraceae bacterium]